MAVRATRLRRLRIRQAIRATTALAVVSVAVLSYLVISKQVTLVVDGRPQAIRTMSADVAELLEGEGIDLAAGFSVQPPPATRLADGMTVKVDSLAELRAVAGQTSSVGVWVMEGTNGPWSKIAGLVDEGSPSASGAGTAPVVAARAVVMGKVHDVLTNAATAGELLSAMGIKPDADDRVRPSPSTPLHPGIRLRYDRIRVFQQDLDTAIPFTSGTTTSTGLDPGEVRLVQAGVDGVLRTTYRVRIRNGKVVRRVVLGRHVVRIRPSAPACTTRT